MSEITVGLITIGQHDYREFPGNNGDDGSILEALGLFLTRIYSFRYLNFFSACHVFHGECVSGNSGRIHCRGYKDNIPETE